MIFVYFAFSMRLERNCNAAHGQSMRWEMSLNSRLQLGSFVGAAASNMNYVLFLRLPRTIIKIHFNIV